MCTHVKETRSVLRTEITWLEKLISSKNRFQLLSTYLLYRHRFGENHIIFGVGTSELYWVETSEYFHEFFSFGASWVFKFFTYYCNLENSKDLIFHYIFINNFSGIIYIFFFQGMISFQFRDEVECAFGFCLGVLDL